MSVLPDKRPTKETVQVGCPVRFSAEAYVTYGALTLKPNLPYDLQTAVFRLFTNQTVRSTDMLDSLWRVTKVYRPLPDRTFVHCVGVVLRDVRQVDLIELTNTGGTHARVVPELRAAGVSAGCVDVSRQAESSDERRIPVGSRLYCLDKRVDDVVPDRWVVVDCDKHYRVTKIVDEGRHDRPAILVTKQDHERA